MKSAQNLERRDKARLPYVCPIIVNDLMSGETCSARMFNHSDTGIYFESDALLEPGTEVYIGLCHPPSEDRPSDYTCHRTTIMWRKELGGDAHFYYGYGTQAFPPESPGKTKSSRITLGAREKEAVAWAWPQEAGETMFNVVNAYIRATAMEGLPAESSFRLQRVGGEVLGMLK